MKQNLPVVYYEKGKWVFTSPYDYNTRISCKPYGEMSDGTMIWEDEEGKQYTRNKFFGKYYFCEI